jgi:TPR repeat protein
LLSFELTAMKPTRLFHVPVLMLLSMVSAASLAQPAAPSSILRIACEGEAQDADVHVNGSFKGQCPVDVPVPAGAVQVRVTKAAGDLNERVFEQTLRLASGTAKRLDVVLGAPRLNARGLQLQAEEALLKSQDEAARAARAKADAAQRAQLVQKRAESGQVADMLALGRLYQQGDGVPRDPSLAHAWTARAAATGDPEALYRLGRQQLFGLGAPSSVSAAVESLSRAAHAGHLNAMGQLAGIYLRGEGVKPDPVLARQWAHKGMEGSSGHALFVLYKLETEALAPKFRVSPQGPAATAQDIRRDDAAQALLLRAVKAGDSHALLQLGSSPASAAPGQQEALLLRATAPGEDGQPGLVEAARQLGQLHLMRGDHGKAVLWFKRAVDAGSVAALCDLSGFHLEGMGGLSKNPEEALRLCLKGAELGDPGAMLIVGMYHRDGLAGLQASRQRAADWFRKGVAAAEAAADEFHQKFGQGLLKDVTP